MPTFVTFYGYAFEGAPTTVDGAQRGWFSAPSVPHLVASRARAALGRATGERIEIYRCSGVLEGEQVSCDDAELLFDGDVTESLWWFALYCARGVLSKWNAPELVREYLRTTSPGLREVAHRCAWAASLELEDLPRLAARVAMFAASAERPILAAREACRLAGQIAGDNLQAVTVTQERALASALLTVPRASADAIPTNAGGDRPSRRDTTNLADALRVQHVPPPLPPPATAPAPRPELTESLRGLAFAMA